MPVQGLAVETTVLRNKHGMEMHIIDTGAVVQRLYVPDASGQLVDVLAGFDDADIYSVSAWPPAHHHCNACHASEVDATEACLSLTPSLCY